MLEVGPDTPKDIEVRIIDFLKVSYRSSAVWIEAGKYSLFSSLGKQKRCGEWKNGYTSKNNMLIFKNTLSILLGSWNVSRGSVLYGFWWLLIW